MFGRWSSPFLGAPLPKILGSFCCENFQFAGPCLGSQGPPDGLGGGFCLFSKKSPKKNCCQVLGNEYQKIWINRFGVVLVDLCLRLHNPLISTGVSCVFLLLTYGFFVGQKIIRSVCQKDPVESQRLILCRMKFLFSRHLQVWSPGCPLSKETLQRMAVSSAGGGRCWRNRGFLFKEILPSWTLNMTPVPARFGRRRSL